MSAHGTFRYEFVPGWPRLPEGDSFGVVSDMDVDSADRVYVIDREPNNRLLVFDRDGTHLATWGQETLVTPHNIWIGPQDQVHITDRGGQVVWVFATDGTLLQTFGTPGQKGAPGMPFNEPTSSSRAPWGDLYVSDGYGQHRVHRFAAGRHAPSLLGRGGKRARPVRPAARCPCHAGRACTRHGPPERAHPGLRPRGKLPHRMDGHGAPAEPDHRQGRRALRLRVRAAREHVRPQRRNPRPLRHTGRRAGPVPGPPARPLRRFPRRSTSRKSPRPAASKSSPGFEGGSSHRDTEAQRGENRKTVRSDPDCCLSISFPALPLCLCVSVAKILYRRQ